MMHCTISCPALKPLSVGARPFDGISAKTAAATLQRMLRYTHVYSVIVSLFAMKHMFRYIDVEEPWLYRTHDLRRGHAKDLQLSGPKTCCMM